jgi:type II secretory pathway component GspD/PulD (secretin)
MLTRISLLAIMALPLTNIAQAAPCGDLRACAKVMNEVMGQHYIWNEDGEKAKFFASPEVDLNKDNADILFTALLDQAGLARMPIGDGKTYRILRGANFKELEIPVVEASADRAPTLPKTWDWVTMRYKTKSPEEVVSIEQSYRLHVPREARMQADMNAGILIVTGTAPMVRQMYETIKAADKPLSPGAKQQQKEYAARMDAAAAKSKKSE